MFYLDSQWLWYSIGVVLLIVEMIIPGTFFSAIFAVSAILTGVSSIFIDNVLVLCLIFAVISLLGIIFTKPFLEKHFKVNKDVRLSTIDALIDKKGTVLVPIKKNEKGRVKIDHEDWAAASLNEEELTEGEQVIIRKIEGATLIVEKYMERGEKN